MKKERISSIFSIHNEVRLGVNCRGKHKNPNMWRLNHSHLNNQQITKEIKMEIKCKYKQMKVEGR